MLLVAVLTALISVNGAVAALLPVVAVIAVRLRPVAVPAAAAARLRRPCGLAARAHRLAGQRDRLRVCRRGGRRAVRLLRRSRSSACRLLAGTIAIVVFLGERLLPERAARSATRDFGALARTLVEQYDLDHEPETLFSRTTGVAEVVIPPRSALIGETVFPGHGHGQRRPRRPRRPAQGRRPARRDGARSRATRCCSSGTWGALEYHLDDPELLVVDQPALVRRQAVPLGPGAKRTLVVLAGMVILLVYRASCRRRSPGCSRPGRSSSSASSARSRPTAGSRGRR